MLQLSGRYGIGSKESGGGGGTEIAVCVCVCVCLSAWPCKSLGKCSCDEREFQGETKAALRIMAMLMETKLPSWQTRL